MKRTGIKLLSLSLVIVLTSCFSILTSTDFKSGKTVEGRKINYNFSMSEKEDVHNCMALAKEYATEGTNFNRFYRKYSELYNYYQRIDDASTYESVKYYMYGNKDNQDKSLEFSTLLTEVIQTFNDIHHIVYKNDFKYELFAGMTEQEIIDYVGPELSDDFYEKKKELDAIISNYQLLDDSSSSFYDKADEAYVSFVNTANELAKLAGYDNYLSFAYKEAYSREYTYQETDNFYQYVIDYAVPFMNRLDSVIDNEISALSYKEKQNVAMIYEGNGFTECFDLIEDYVKFVGGEMYTTFRDLWYTSKNYYISYDSKATTAAFTTELSNKNIVFFGNRFEPATIVHEFGHYYAGEIVSNNTNGCYDLLETHSQGNEMLFYQYISQHTDLSNSEKRVLNDLQIYDSLRTIVIATLVNELEKRVYLDDDFVLGDADKYVAEILAETGLTTFNLRNYWRLVCIDSAAYYISYAVSAIGALEIYTKAVDNLSNAIKVYNKLVNRDPDEKDFIKVYENAGLISPLSEEAFTLIFNS